MIGLVDNESRESLYAQQPQHPRASSSRRSRSKSAKASASGSRRGSYAPVSPLREQESGNGNAGRTSKNSRKEDVEGEGIPLRPYPYPTSGKRLKGKGVHDEHIRRDTEDEKSDDEGGDKEDTDDEDEDIEAGELEDLDPEDMASWVGQPHIRGSSESVRMALLTLSLVGLQFTWGIEMTYCTPYLLSLGLTKSLTSLVWLAGPLSGLLTQPLIGVLSDSCTSRYGRRRPFMILGSLLVALCLILMAWASEFVSIFTSPETNKEGAQQATIVVAVLSIYAVDFAINAVQACCRSLIVDTLPIPKQQLGSAWASRMVAIGHLVGYAAGTLDLVSIFGTSLGSTQFKKLVILAITGLLSTVGLTSWAVTERVLISSRGDGRKGKDGGAHSSANPIEIFRKIFKTTANLPPRIQAICWAQFWAWIGWFPFLFYSSTWVGETYYRYDAPRIAAEEAAAASASASQSAYGAEFVTRIVKRMLSTRTEGATAEPGSESGDALGDIGRIGSMALVVFSLVTFASAFLLPLLVRSPDSKADQFDYTPRPPRAMKRVMSWLETRKPDLLTAWFCGHFVFSCAMICAPFASSFRFATVLVAACGIPWVLGSWAPYTFLGVEVNRLSSTSSSHQPYRRLSVSTVHSMQSLNSSGEREEPLRLQHDPDEDVASTGELSGIYFGILNIYTTLPQFVGTFISMIVFAILEPGKSPELAEGGEQAPPAEGVNAIGVCLFIGAISTLGAAVATKKLKKLQ